MRSKKNIVTEERTLYAIAFAAVYRGPNPDFPDNPYTLMSITSFNCTICIATSEAEAIGLGIKTCQELYPKDKHYTEHTCVVHRAEEDLVQRSVQCLS